MITPLSDFEYLGNSLYKFNSNMNELNIRIDNIYNDSDKWNALFTTMQTISSSLQTFVVDIPSISGTWVDTSNLVYNLRGFWEEPISIVFHNTFNMVANFSEVRNWLNQNFPCENFPTNQLIKCDYLCKNYNPEKFQQYPYIGENKTSLEIYSKTFAVSLNEVYSYLSYLNQANSIVSIINSILNRIGRRDLFIHDWTEIENIVGFVGYNYNSRQFVSSEFDTTQILLQYLYSYILQYKIIKQKLKPLEDKGINTIPEYILDQFTNRSIEVYSGGSFYFRNIDNIWELYPYIGNEYCTGGSCSDCYSILDINTLYTTNKPCFNSFEYVLEECYE